MKRWTGILVGSTLLVGALASPAGAELGPRFGIHTHVTHHAYEAPLHHINGRVGIVNKTDKTEVIKCAVVALIKGPGDTHKKGRDTVKARIPGGDTKRPHFRIEIRDENHDFDNVPSHIATHCRKV